MLAYHFVAMCVCWAVSIQVWGTFVATRANGWARLNVPMTLDFGSVNTVPWKPTAVSPQPAKHAEDYPFHGFLMFLSKRTFGFTWFHCFTQSKHLQN